LQSPTTDASDCQVDDDNENVVPVSKGCLCICAQGMPGTSSYTRSLSRSIRAAAVDQEFMTDLPLVTVHVPVYSFTLVQCAGFGTTHDALLLMY